MERFWRWFDRCARLDFAGNVLGFFFDWRGWIAATLGGGGGAVTFLLATIDGRSPLDIWVFVVVVTAALAVVAYFSIGAVEKLSVRRLAAHKESVPSGTQIPEPPAQIGLLEAAKQTHEQLRHTAISIVIEGIANSDDDILTWYCNRLAMPIDGNPPMLIISGKHLPSRIVEPIDDQYLTRYDFVVEGESIILQERNGHRRFENLSVDADELAAAIKQLAKRQA
jgi:hypothetical protein